MKAISDETGLKAGEHNDRYDLDWRECTGWCSNSPNVEIDDTRIIFEADPKTIMEKIDRGDGENTKGREIVVEDNFLGDL